MYLSRMNTGRRTWTAVGRVEAVWTRREAHLPVTAVPAVEAVAGFGLRGDCHADALSPRQVLLAWSGTYRRLELPPGSLRENFTVSSDVRAWPSGSLVRIGSDIILWITFPCDPCARLNRHRPGLIRAVGNERGVLARVVHGGTAGIGDEIRVWAGALAAWSERWQDRVRWIAESVPRGQVVEYAQLARLAGVPSTYCRAFPRVLAAPAGVSSHRAVSSAERLEVPRWSGADLFATDVWHDEPDPA